MRNMLRLCITCDSHVPHAMVRCVSHMRQPTFNVLSQDATQPATRRFNMRLACSVAYGPIRLFFFFFFFCKNQKLRLSISDFFLFLFLLDHKDLFTTLFDNFWIKWPFGESSSSWRFVGLQEHKNNSKFNYPQINSKLAQISDLSSL